jgi:hypothetical protein
MPLPALGVVANFVLVNGTRQAAIKYGPKAVKQAQKQIVKREKALLDKAKPAGSTKNQQEAARELKRQEERAERLLRENKGKTYRDIDGEPLDEVPLRFDMNTGGLLSDDRQVYGIGGLVTKLFKLAKKKQPKEVKEQDIDKVLNSLSEEQMDKLSPIEIEQLLDMDLAKSGVDNIPAKSTKKDIDDVLGDLTDKEMENLSDIEIEQLLDMDLEKYGRKGKMSGGLLDDDRQKYGMGAIVKKLLKKKPSKQTNDIKYAEKEIDGLIDLRKKREAQLELDLENATKGEQSDLLEQYNDDWNLITQKINVYQDQLRELGVKPTAKNMIEKSRTSKAEGGMMPDDDMEDGYTRFIMEEALSEEEEDMLTSKLEQDEELQMLFDKVIDVAQEFAGSGPVDGPGSGVSDSIPARLSDGEFVFTAKAVEEIGEDTLMSMMKEAEAAADERQGLAEGGMPEDNNVNVQADALLGMDMSPDPTQEAINENMIKYQPYVRS